MAIENWNRIINIRFFSQNGKEDVSKAIICPTKGRKPNITISAVAFTDSVSFTFNLSIKNLYMDFTGEPYPIIQVEAGYENAVRVAFVGSVNYMYRQNPGPESVTVIQCRGVNLQTWFDSTIKLRYKKGYTIKEVIEKISSTFNILPPVISDKVATMTSKEPFEFDGAAKDALDEIKRRFLNTGLQISYTDKRIKVNLEQDPGIKKRHYLSYLSSAPQITGGAEGSSALATITCPYNPEIQVGDLITFNTNFYTTSSNFFNYKKGNMTIQVSQVDIKFSTVGMVNQMTIMGSKVNI